MDLPLPHYFVSWKSHTMGQVTFFKYEVTSPLCLLVPGVLCPPFSALSSSLRAPLTGRHLQAPLPSPFLGFSLWGSAASICRTDEWVGTKRQFLETMVALSRWWWRWWTMSAVDMMKGEPTGIADRLCLSEMQETGRVPGIFAWATGGSKQH